MEPNITEETMSTVEDKRAPWETYSASLDEKLDPKLEQEIAEYSKKRHEKSSTQNEEELARWKEENAALAQQYQFLSPDEYSNISERMGKIRHAISFIKLLKKLGLHCLYRRHPHKDKLTLLVIKHNRSEVGCWVANGYMPEYSIVRFDDKGVPLNEQYRGWRTALLQLILKGYLDEREVNHFFGRAKGPASERYNSTLFSVRNTYVKVT